MLILVTSEYINRTTVVRVTTANGSATSTHDVVRILNLTSLFSAGSDYTTILMEVIIHAGNEEETIRVPITDGNMLENEETFIAVLSSEQHH